MVLVAVGFNALLHDPVLEMLALVRRDGFGRDVGEVENFFRDIVIVESWMSRERRVGPVVVQIESSDAMVVVVVGEEFAELDCNVFYKET